MNPKLNEQKKESKKTKGLWRVDEKEMGYVKEAMETGLTGKLTKEFETRFAARWGSEYAIGVNSGTSALHTALGAIDLKPEDEVIVPPLTFAATALCVLYMNAIPVFADVDPLIWNIDPQSVKKLITKKTKAIITVSLYGLTPEMDEILGIAKENNIFVIEDNAQCVLGKYKGKLAGTLGDLSIFSFQRSKHLTTGDGGLILTNDERLAQRARKFADLGYRTLTAKPISNENFKEEIQNPNFLRHEMVGFNFRLPEVCAAMGLAQLDKLDDLIERRKQIGEMYSQAVVGCDWLTPQFTPEHMEHSYWTFVLKLDTDRVSWAEFRKIFLKNGGEPFYAAWILTYLEPALRGKSFSKHGVVYEKGLCPVAEDLQPKLIQLKTNFEDLNYAKSQAEILSRTIKEIS